MEYDVIIQYLPESPCICQHFRCTRFFLAETIERARRELSSDPLACNIIIMKL